MSHDLHERGDRLNLTAVLKEISHLLALATRELHELAARKDELEWIKSQSSPATKHDLNESVKKIMQAIDNFAAAQRAYNTAQATAIDGLVSSLAGVTQDVVDLQAKIVELQNSPGTLTPADQANLDEMQADGAALVTRLQGVQSALGALDAQNPPTVPTP